MVLVDSAHEDQDTRHPTAFAQLNEQVMAQTAQFLLVPQLANSLGILAMSPQDYPDAYLPPLSDSAKEVYKGVVLSDTRYFAAVAEQYAHVDDNFAEVRDMHITTLGDIPLVVLSAGKVDLPQGYSLTAEDVAEFQAVQAQMQAELASLSSRGELVLAEESTHYIQFDQPELVIDAIRRVVQTPSPP